MKMPIRDQETSDEEFAQRAKQQFESSVASLDAATLSQLNQRRQRALAEIGSSAPATHWFRWLPATGVAAAAVIAVVMLQGPGVSELPAFETAAPELEILISDEDLEMLEDLEFYSWLDTMVTDNAS